MVYYRRGLTRIYLVLWALWVLVVLVGYPWYMKGEYSRQYAYWLGEGQKDLAAAYLKEFQALTYTSWFKALLQYWPYTLVALVGVPVALYGLLYGIILTARWMVRGFKGDSPRKPT